MYHGLVSRSFILACAVLLVTAASAFADTVAGDADVVTAGAQSTRDLGTVAPGSVLHVPIDFRLSCRGLSHVDPGQSVTLTGAATVPAGGSATVTDGIIGPVPATWADDTAGATGCPDPAPEPLTASTLSQATLIAPMTAGGPYKYTILFTRSLSPEGVRDAGATTNGTAATFTVTVVANTAPTLDLPDAASHEGNTSGGWIGDWTATADDNEDNPDPTPTCHPAPGDVVPLGTTTIACSVIDSGGLEATGTFDMTVVDTLAPRLRDVPASRTVVTGTGGGAVVAYGLPGATDIVDPKPAVSCLPASGSVFPVGATTVTCTARDGSGNAAKARFDVTVVWLRAAFDAPIGPTDVMTVHSGRTVPVKVAIYRDGAPDLVGPVRLTLAAADGCPASATASKRGAPKASPGRGPVRAATSVDKSFSFEGGRWTYGLDLSDWGLAEGCYRADVLDAELVAGSFWIVVEP